MAASEFAARTRPDVLLLFDVDGTLTVPRKVGITCKVLDSSSRPLTAALTTSSLVDQVIEKQMQEVLATLRNFAVLGIVGGSDFVKIDEQMSGLGACFGSLTSPCRIDPVIGPVRGNPPLGVKVKITVKTSCARTLR